MTDPAHRLREAKNLFVTSIRELSNNDLRLVVVAGKADEVPVETEVGSAFPVRADAECGAFEITWWGYVAYSVRNESYFKPEDEEILGEGAFGTRENSSYRRYIADSTFASDEFPGPLTHWYLYTEWHCIDVVSVDPPEVKELSSADVTWDLRDRAP